MRAAFVLLTFFLVSTVLRMSNVTMADLPDYCDPLALQIESAMEAAKDLPADRQKLLRQAADAIVSQIRAGDSARLVFICTANSRRSQLGQVWGELAADYYGLERIETFSGGTEATACNPRTINALKRAGFEVVEESTGQNPHYRVRYKKNSGPTIELYSKKFTDEANPQESFVALMCCDDADEACPIVPGAVARFRLSYEDPKQADDTNREAAAYDARSRQIAAEMFYLMGEIAKRK